VSANLTPWSRSARDEAEERVLAAYVTYHRLVGRWPTVAHVARLVGVSPRTMHRVLARLVLLRQVRPGRGSTVGHASVPCAVTWHGERRLERARPAVAAVDAGDMAGGGA
jgi:hypothetical protein